MIFPLATLASMEILLFLQTHQSLNKSYARASPLTNKQDLIIDLTQKIIKRDANLFSYGMKHKILIRLLLYYLSQSFRNTLNSLKVTV